MYHTQKKEERHRFKTARWLKWSQQIKPRYKGKFEPRPFSIRKIFHFPDHPSNFPLYLSYPESFWNLHDRSVNCTSNEISWGMLKYSPSMTEISLLIHSGMILSTATFYWWLTATFWLTQYFHLYLDLYTTEVPVLVPRNINLRFVLPHLIHLSHSRIQDHPPQHC